jgi:hypothetical protein
MVKSTNFGEKSPANFRQAQLLQKLNEQQKGR